MVGTRLALADSLIFQTGQRRKYVNRRCDALTVQITA